uniref:F-box domain-containing protein n=1 Tax=Leersia perrieri TaxID=77586 RepID=A0A0D9X5C7_9ORYZ
MAEADSASAAAAVPAIPEDVIIEILARVRDPTTLFRCATACKRWRRLIADRAFIRRHWPTGTRPSLLGFFAQRHQMQANSRPKLTKLFPSRAPPLVARDGVRGYAILTAADHRISQIPSDGYNTFFQVMVIGNHRDDNQRFFSATTNTNLPPSWITPTNCSERTLRRVRSPYGHRIAAVSNGIAYWLFHGEQESLCTLDVSIDTDKIGATRLPLDILPLAIRMDGSTAWLYVSVDARLSLALIHNNYLNVCTRKETQGAPACWVVWKGSLSGVCIGEESGTMLTLYHSDPDRAYLLDLPSGVTTWMKDWSRWFNYLTAVPFEINWPAFFLSRLRSSDPQWVRDGYLV